VTRKIAAGNPGRGVTALRGKVTSIACIAVRRMKASGEVEAQGKRGQSVHLSRIGLKSL
jgi:hypothetical protein